MTVQFEAGLNPLNIGAGYQAIPNILLKPMKIGLNPLNIGAGYQALP